MEGNNQQMDQMMLLSQKKSVAIAILLSVFVVGLGFAYLKDFERFLVYLISYVVVTVVNFLLITQFSPVLFMVIVVLLGVFYIFQIIRVYQVANEYNDKIMMDAMNMR